MLFTGEYEHTIDAKRRMAIPAELRARLDPDGAGLTFYLSEGANGAIWLWLEETFERIAAVIEESLLPAEEMTEFDELTFPTARRVDTDSAGRIRLSERMLAEVGIGSRVVILGMRDHLELRSPEDWETRRRDTLARKTEILDRARRTIAHSAPREGAGGA